MMNKISVIIPLFNKVKYIDRALKSVLDQSEPVFEVIVVNDGSTDGGEDVVKNFKDRRIKLINQSNQGSSVARNQGIKTASSELIAFLDADDLWKPGFLKKIRELREKFPKAGAYATSYEIVTPTGRRLPAETTRLPDGGSEGLIKNYFDLALGFPVWSSAVVIPKRVLDEVGGFPEGEHLGEDLDLWLRIALRYPIAWSSACLAVYHQDAENRVCTTKRWTGEPAISVTAQRAIQSGMVPPDLINDLREYVAYFQLDAARDCLVQGEKDIAFHLLNCSRETRKFSKWWWRLRIVAALPGNAAYWLWKIKQLKAK